MFRLFVALVCLCIPLSGTAKDAELVSPDPVLYARMVRITSELRCLVCQNQTIADSNSGLAEDLRTQVMVQMRSGQSDQQIIEFMTARYGDFVLYRPPLKGTTAILWFGPGLLLVAGLVTLFLVLRKRSHLPPEAFDPEDPPLPGNHS